MAQPPQPPQQQQVAGNFWTRQMIDEAGKTGVRLEKTIAVIGTIEMVGMFFDIWQSGPAMLVPGIVTLGLLTLGFVGAAKRSRGALLAYFWITVGLMVAGAVAVGLFVAAVVVGAMHQRDEPHVEEGMRMGMAREGMWTVTTAIGLVGVAVGVGVLCAEIYTLVLAWRMARQLREAAQRAGDVAMQPMLAAPDARFYPPPAAAGAAGSVSGGGAIFVTTDGAGQVQGQPIYIVQGPGGGVPMSFMTTAAAAVQQQQQQQVPVAPVPSTVMIPIPQAPVPQAAAAAAQIVPLQFPPASAPVPVPVPGATMTVQGLPPADSQPPRV